MSKLSSWNRISSQERNKPKRERKSKSEGETTLCDWRMMMKLLLPFVLILIIAATVVGQPVHSKLESAAWLAGCWESANKDRSTVITEMWMSPAGGSMLGVGRTVRDGKTADFEFVRIIEEAGALIYVSKPEANKDETRFSLTTSGRDELVFENPAHDFPQRIIYKKSGKNILAARIEGRVNGKDRGIDFAYTRVGCE